MSRTCTVCRHQKRDEIDRALLEGQTFRYLSEHFGCSETALFRHKKSHIPKALARIREIEEEVGAATLFDRLREINDEARAILKEARNADSKDDNLALKAMARIEKQLELEARLLGELDEASKIAVGININNQSVQYDLSVLSNEELQTMLALMNKATIKQIQP